MKTQLDFNCLGLGFLHASHANSPERFIKCASCKQSRQIEFFAKRKDAKNGRRNQCKQCCAIALNKWKQSNREGLRAYHKAYSLKNREKIRRYAKESYRKNAIKIRQKHNCYRARNKKYFAEYQKNRVKKDPSFKLRKNISRRVSFALLGSCKSSKVLDLVGCSAEFLRLWLESKWKPGMSWENYGLRGWHIDHIRPCSSFDLEKPEQQRLCFHFLNLQPLWAHENLFKSDAWDGNP